VLEKCSQACRTERSLSTVKSWTGVTQVLFWKKRGEEALQRSGIPYTIVRPGGLLDAPRPGQAAGQIVMEGPNTFGLPPKRTPGSILRSQVPPPYAFCSQHVPYLWHAMSHANNGE
jgi:hypothetical protein